MRRPRDLVDHWIAMTPWLDWLLAGAVAALLVSLPSLQVLSRPTRLQGYQILVGVAGALLGFYMATVAILLGLLDSQRTGLRQAFDDGRAALIQPLFFAAIRSAALVLMVGTTLLLIDSSVHSGNFQLMIWFTITALSALRGVKVFVLLQLMIQIAVNNPDRT